MGHSLAFAVEGQHVDGSWGLLFDTDLPDTAWWETHWSDSQAQANAEGLVDALVGKRDHLLGALTGIPMPNLLQRDGHGGRHGLVRTNDTPHWSWPDDVCAAARATDHQRCGWWLWSDAIAWPTRLATPRPSPIWRAMWATLGHLWPLSAPDGHHHTERQRAEVAAFGHGMDAFLRSLLGVDGTPAWLGAWMEQAIDLDSPEDAHPIGATAHARLANVADFPPAQHWTPHNVRVLFRVH